MDCSDFLVLFIADLRFLAIYIAARIFSEVKAKLTGHEGLEGK